MINVYCSNKGWLFEDLKRHLQNAGAIASEVPLPNARAWICIRTDEAHLSPDPARTVVQVHDVMAHGDLRRFDPFGVVSFVHPAPMHQWLAQGFAGRVDVRPIGARSTVPTSPLPHRPTLGFFCREMGNGSKRAVLFGEALQMAQRQVTVDALMIGGRLEAIAHLASKYEQRAARVHDYARIDALVTTSTSPMVPLSAYEAAAAGKTVITTPREFPSTGDGDDWPMVRTADTASGLAELIVDTVRHRRCYPPARPWLLEGWVAHQIQLAIRLTQHDTHRPAVHHPVAAPGTHHGRPARRPAARRLARQHPSPP